MDQHSHAFWLFKYSRLPVREICSEEIDRKCGSLFKTPTGGNRPEQASAGGHFLCERSPLRVTHHPLAIAFPNSAELTTRDQRRLRRARISSSRRHGVSEVQPSGLDSNQLLTRRWIRSRGLPNL